MDAINKTNKQLHREFEAALKKLEEKTYNLLHYGSYDIKNLSRDFVTNKVDFAVMEVGDHTIDFCAPDLGETKIVLQFDNNPINQTLLDSWDRQTIDRDIEYHRKKLDSLEKLKQTLK